METPFFGGSYPGFSTNLANDRTINLYPELVETKQGKQIGALYSTPGQRKLLTLPNFGVGTVMGPCRGSRTMATTNKMIQVYGNTVMTVDTNNITVLLGHINTSTGPVDIIDNGTQVAVSDGYQLWAYTLVATATATLITTLPSAPGVLVIQDGFGLTNILGTDQFYQSNLNDLTTWGALNFSSADAEPSPIVGMATLFRQVWIFKQNTTEVWNNVGGAGFTFQRMQGVYLQVGCQAPYSVATSGERVIWLGQNALGTSSVFMNNGYEAKPISTHAVDYKIIEYQKATQKGIIDAIGFVYNQAGHTFYVLTFPGGNATWVYDLTTQLWHERGEWVNGQYNRWDPSSYCYYNKQHVVGSSTAAQLSVLDINYPTDDLISSTQLNYVNPKRWVRRWRALGKSLNSPVRFESLRLDMATGLDGFNKVVSSAPLAITGHITGARLYDTGTYQYIETGGIRPYSNMVVSSGALPTGARVNTDGLATYTYTAPGSFNWSLTGQDYIGNTASHPDSINIPTELMTAWIDPFVSTWGGGAPVCCAVANGVAVIGSYGGLINYSLNAGATWVQVNLNYYPQGIYSVVYFNGSWYALGGPVTNAAVSPGNTFTFTNFANAPTITIDSATVFNNSIYAGYALPSASPTTATSIVYMVTAGLPWVLVPTGFNYGNVTSMCYGKGYYFLLCTSGKVLRSADLVNFTLAYDTTNTATNSISFMATSNILLVTSTTNTVYRSTDLGVTWSIYTGSLPIYVTSTRSIFIGSSLFAMYRSTDGINWTVITVPNNSDGSGYSGATDGNVTVFIQSTHAYIGTA